MKYFLTVFLSFFSLQYGFSQKSWTIIEEQPETGYQLSYYIKGSKMAVVDEFSTLVYDTKNSNMTVILPQIRAYYTGTLLEYREGMVAQVKTRAQKARGENKKLLLQMADALEKATTSSRDISPDIEVRLVSDGPVVLNYPTKKYQVIVNGKVRREMLISNELPVFSQIGFEGIAAFRRQMSLFVQYNVFFEDNAQYIALMDQGLMLSYTDFEAGYAIKTLVKSVSQRVFSDKQFLPPTGYKKLSAAELASAQLDMSGGGSPDLMP
jgi:hypothetical protein